MTVAGARGPGRAEPAPAAAVAAVPPSAATSAAGLTAGAAGAAVASPRIPAWFERPGWLEIGPIGWIRSRMAETPIRPDRSRLLNRERGGRLDRLDLWILVVLVIAGMGFRMFRLAEPARMHFDEVYHARTATEFLQSWRYGIDHTIYEWTHPHLAKYAMAGGIALFAGRDVAASSQVTTSRPGRGARAPPRGRRVDPSRRPGVGRDR